MINYKNFLLGEEEQTIDNLREQNEQLKEILSIREQQLLSLVNANSSYSERMEHYVELAKKADADKEMIQNSEFWKMTKPVRLLTDILKKDKVFRFPEKIQFSATIQTFEDIVKYFERGDRKIIGKKQLIAYGKKETKKVLLVTHEMMLTGAPIALFYFAKMLKEEEMCPVILAPSGGMLEDECKRYGIPALIDPSLYKEKRYKLYIDLFDMVIANTIASAPVINGLSESRIPVLWWLHEAEASYQDENFFKAMPQHIPDNVTVYTVGDYAKKRLLYHRPLYKSKELLYYVPQNNVEGKDVTFKLPKEAKGKTVFALIGVQEYRKGFDILINAIRNLNEEERKKSYFVFVGKKYYKTIYEDIDQICKDFPENTLYIEKLDRKEINDLYKEIDCYICASRDDPMPIVVTEAMQNNVAVIVSENTGTATIVKTEKCGLTYKNNNVEELTEKIIYMLNNSVDRKEFGKNGYKAYLKYFAKEAFYENAKKAIKDTYKNAEQNRQKSQFYDCQKQISIVIPTYNAGIQFDQMLDRLRNQRYIKPVEIVIIDSGSTDNTLKIAEKHKAHIYKIKHEDFSHSFARNMGAQKARGEIIIFMTQDALPMGDSWISKIVKPLDECKVAAVSVAELCPETTELFYKVATKEHAEFCRTAEGNQFNCLNDDDDALELRKKASLTDITCAIHAEIFKKYAYRFNYAEDLDMGIRLLRDGYRIALLTDVKVLHGHNRSCGYYIKRALVEQISFDSILPQCATKPDEVNNVALRIVSAAEDVEKTLQIVRQKLEVEEKTIAEYLDSIIAEFDKYMNNQRYFAGRPLKSKDEVVNDCVQRCQKYCMVNYKGDYSILEGLKEYISTSLKNYFEINEYTKGNSDKIEKELIESINDCIEKQMSVWFGVELSRLRYNICLYNEFGDLLMGV